MVALAFSCRLIFSFYLILVVFSSSINCTKPTISHSRDPFALSRPIASCIEKELHRLVQTLTVQRVQEVGKIEEMATCRSQVVTISVKMLEWRYLMVNSSKWGVKEGMQRGFAGLLQEISAALKLRYEWAVAIDGPLWVGYNANKQTSRKYTASIRNTTQEEDDDGVRKEACIPRGDVLISHNGGVGSMPGMDILRAPRSLISENNEFFLMMQGDCNLVLYETLEGHPLWNSGSGGRGSKCSLHLLQDATLAIYDGHTQHQVWNSSSSSSSSCSFSSVFMLILQNNGNAVIYDLLNGLPMWATGTNQ